MYLLCCCASLCLVPGVGKCVAIMVDAATCFHIRKAQRLVLSPLPLTRRPSIATAVSKAGQVCSGVASPPRAPVFREHWLPSSRHPQTGLRSAF